MEATKLKLLIDKYYSGDILPDEYQTLLSSLKKNAELTPELNAERHILLAIESCQPSEPEDLENRLNAAIDHRNRRRYRMLKVAYSISAAAIVLIFIMAGMFFHENRSIYESEQLTKVSIPNQTCGIQETIEPKEPIGVNQNSSVMLRNPASYSSISDEELENSAQIVDEALTDILVSIHSVQNDIIEIMDNIEISQTSDYNIL